MLDREHQRHAVRRILRGGEELLRHCVLANSENAPVSHSCIFAMKTCGTIAGSRSSDRARCGARRDARMHDPQPARAPAVQDGWKPATEQLLEADGERSDVRLLAETNREPLRFDLAEEDAHAHLDRAGASRITLTRTSRRTRRRPAGPRTVTGRRPTDHVKHTLPGCDGSDARPGRSVRPRPGLPSSTPAASCVSGCSCDSVTSSAAPSPGVSVSLRAMSAAVPPASTSNR